VAFGSPVLEVGDEDEVCVDDEVRDAVVADDVGDPEGAACIRDACQCREDADVAGGDPQALAVAEEGGGGVEVGVVGLVAVLDGAGGVGDEVGGPAAARRKRRLMPVEAGEGQSLQVEGAALAEPVPSPRRQRHAPPEHEHDDDVDRVHDGRVVDDLDALLQEVGPRSRDEHLVMLHGARLGLQH